MVKEAQKRGVKRTDVEDGYRIKRGSKTRKRPSYTGATPSTA